MGDLCVQEQPCRCAPDSLNGQAPGRQDARMTVIRTIREDDAPEFLRLCRRLDEESTFMMLEPGERRGTAAQERRRLRRVLYELIGFLIIRTGQGSRRILPARDDRGNCSAHPRPRRANPVTAAPPADWTNRFKGGSLLFAGLGKAAAGRVTPRSRQGDRLSAK